MFNRKIFMHRNRTRIPMIIVTAQNNTGGFGQYNMKRKIRKMYNIRKNKTCYSQMIKLQRKYYKNQVLVLIREFYKNENDFLYKY